MIVRLALRQIWQSPLPSIPERLLLKLKRQKSTQFGSATVRQNSDTPQRTDDQGLSNLIKVKSQSTVEKTKEKMSIGGKGGTNKGCENSHNLIRTDEVVAEKMGIGRTNVLEQTFRQIWQKVQRSMPEKLLQKQYDYQKYYFPAASISSR